MKLLILKRWRYSPINYFYLQLIIIYTNITYKPYKLSTKRYYYNNTHKPLKLSNKRNYSNHAQKVRKFSTKSSRLSFTDWPHILNMIEEVTRKEQNRNEPNLWECDYSRITSAILPYYFHVTHNKAWVITPELNYLENNHPDYTIFKVSNNCFNLQVHVVVEVKSKTGHSWNKLLEQMFTKADVAKNNPGRLWAIGQKGLEICFFRFEVLKYNGQKPDWYTNFEPLNLSNLAEPQLDNLNVKYEHCDNHGFARIALLKWRLDNRDHTPYVNHMFEYIRTLDP